MPRLTNSVPKYRKHKRSGQAVVTLNGKDFYLGPHGTKASRIEYDRLIGEWLAAGRRVANDGQEQLAVVEVISRFYKHAQSYYVKNGKPTGTAEGFKPALSALKSLYGKTATSDFGPLALKSLQQRMIDNGLSRRYINENTARIKQVFRWAASEELIPASVSQALGTVDGLRKHRTEARETSPIQPVDDHTVNETLPHLSPIVADMIRLQRLTGARPGEVCEIRPENVDRTGDVWLYVPGSHKTEHHDKHRTVYIGPQAQAILAPYLIRDAKTFCFSPAESEAKRRAAQHANRKTPLSCGNRPGTNRKRKPKRKPADCYTKESYRRAIHRACDKAAIDRWSPNRLRHSAATEIRKDFGLEAAQVVLGHSKADVTQIYAEADKAKAIDVMRRIG